MVSLWAVGGSAVSRIVFMFVRRLYENGALARENFEFYGFCFHFTFASQMTELSSLFI